MDLKNYTLSLINLDLTANKMLFRMRKAESKLQKDGLLQIVNDLDQIKETLKELKSENDELLRKCFKLHSENLELNELKKIIGMKKIVNLDKLPKDSIFGICYENGIDVYKDDVNFKFKKNGFELVLHRHLNFDNAMKQIKNTFKI